MERDETPSREYKSLSLSARQGRQQEIADPCVLNTAAAAVVTLTLMFHDLPTFKRARAT